MTKNKSYPQKFYMYILLALFLATCFIGYFVKLNYDVLLVVDELGATVGIFIAGVEVKR